MSKCLRCGKRQKYCTVCGHLRCDCSPCDWCQVFVELSEEDDIIDEGDYEEGENP